MHVATVQNENSSNDPSLFHYRTCRLGEESYKTKNATSKWDEMLPDSNGFARRPSALPFLLPPASLCLASSHNLLEQVRIKVSMSRAERRLGWICSEIPSFVTTMAARRSMTAWHRSTTAAVGSSFAERGVLILPPFHPQHAAAAAHERRHTMVDELHMRWNITRALLAMLNPWT